VTLLLDAGGLIAYDRRNKSVEASIERAERAGRDVGTTSGAVAQAWRDGARQARLARLLRGVHEVELTREQARRIGLLLGRSGTADVVDASLIDIANDGDEILTSDPDDIAALASAAGLTVIVTRVT
jgi:hypothetical protein